MEAAVRSFFSSSRFAVAGASSDPAKFGNKLVNWYIQRNIPVTPINARSAEISVTGRGGKKYTVPTVASPREVSSKPPFLAASSSPTEGGGEISLSIVTPPSVTLSVLKDASASGIRRLWFQPGTFDQACLDYVASSADPKFEVAIVPGHNRNMADPSSKEAESGDLRSRGEEGWCVLMDGDVGLALAKENKADSSKI